MNLLYKGAGNEMQRKNLIQHLNDVYLLYKDASDEMQGKKVGKISLLNDV